jgi:hypothetical protein
MDTNNFEKFSSAEMTRDEMSNVFGADGGGYGFCQGVMCPTDECVTHEFVGWCIPPGSPYANGKQKRWTSTCSWSLVPGSGLCWEIVVVA